MYIEKVRQAIPRRHPDLLTVGNTAAFVVDVQERFRPHIHGFDEMVAAIKLLIRACNEIGVPVAASEQYPEGLGVTVPELAELLTAAHAPLFSKMEISSCAADGWDAQPENIRDADTFIVVGIETHVCVNQTVHDLLERGKRVHVVADAVGSRDPWQREVALERLSKAGATITSVEMAIFELLGTAGTAQFKSVQKLIKEFDQQRLASHARAQEEVHA